MIPRFNILRNEAGDGGEGGGGSGGGQTLLGDQGQGGGGQQQQQQSQQQQGGGSFNFRDLVGDDGNFVPNYHEKLPEGLKEHSAHFLKYKDPMQALQHTLNLQQILGKKADAVVIPGADASADEWAPVLKKLGVPDEGTPEAYGIKKPDELPPGVEWNDEHVKQFATLAKEIGLTPQQAAKLMAFDTSRAGEMATNFRDKVSGFEEAEFKKQGDILTKEWGTGPEAEKKKSLASRAALTFGFTAEEIGTDPLFRNARFVMTLARAGALMSEDTLARGNNSNAGGDLKAKAMDVINNPQNPLHKRYHAGDEEANQIVRGWFKAAG